MYTNLEIPLFICVVKIVSGMMFGKFSLSEKFSEKEEKLF